MSAQFVEGHPQIRANAGKAAIQRGPIVYCLEEKDNGNLLASLSFSSQSKLTEKFDPDLFEGVIVVEAQGWKDDSSSWDGEPYRLMDKKSSPTVIRAIPYYLWGNRGKGEMAVWTRIH
jgi:uncharacterized protein